MRLILTSALILVPAMLFAFAPVRVSTVPISASLSIEDGAFRYAYRVANKTEVPISVIRISVVPADVTSIASPVGWKGYLISDVMGPEVVWIAAPDTYSIEPGKDLPGFALSSTFGPSDVSFMLGSDLDDPTKGHTTGPTTPPDSGPYMCAALIMAFACAVAISTRRRA